MSDRTDEERLDDVRQYASEAIETLGDATYADFLNDSNLHRAVFYLVAVVGEAASKNFTIYPAPVSCRSMASLPRFA